MIKTPLLIAATIAAASTLALPANAAPAGQFRGAMMFWLLDRNESGAIEKAEIEALRTVIFDSVDVNHDGSITQDELSAAVEAVRKVRNMRHDRGEEPRKLPVAERLGQRLGIDADGLTKSEFVSRQPKAFERADANGDGTVTKSEFENAAVPFGRLLMMD